MNYITRLLRLPVHSTSNKQNFLYQPVHGQYSQHYLGLIMCRIQNSSIKPHKALSFSWYMVPATYFLLAQGEHLLVRNGICWSVCTR